VVSNEVLIEALTIEAVSYLEQLSAILSLQKAQQRESWMKLRSVTSLLFVLLAAIAGSAQDKSTGAVKGRVRVEKGSAEGVAVILRQGEREVARVNTDKKGDFTISRIAPGVYGLQFRKPGLSVGSIDDIQIRAGKIRSLGDRLYLTVDEGSIAFIRGSVFTEDGRSVPNVRVELAKVLTDGSVRKLDVHVTTETGQFTFRLASPDAARYRITVKAEGSEADSKDVEVDGAAVYRVALSLKPSTR
jgi:hypothetical protein